MIMWWDLLAFQQLFYHLVPMKHEAENSMKWKTIYQGDEVIQKVNLTNGG